MLTRPSQTLTLNGYGSASGTNTSGSAAIYSSITSGSDIIDAPLLLAAGGTAYNSTINAAGVGGTLTINGKISGSTSPLVLSIAGGSNLTLNGANDISTAVSLSGANLSTAAILALGNNSALGTGTVTVSNGVTITASGGARNIGNAVVFSANGIIGGTNDLTLSGAFTSSGSNSRTLTVNNSGNTTLSGSVYLSETSGTGRTFSVAGTGAVTISGVIADFNGSGTAGNLTYTGSNTLTLTNTNTYAGNTSISGGGTISVSAVGNAGTSGNLGVGATINLGASATSGTLLYTGSGETTSKAINLQAGSGGGGVLDQSGSGLLKFTADVTSTGASSKTFTLQGSTAGTGEIAGKIGDPKSGKVSILKQGTGTWTLSGANSYSGTTTVTGGTLILSSTGSINSSTSVQVSVGALTLQNASALSDSGTLNLTNGTTLNLVAGSGTTEVINGLVLNGTPVQAGTYAAADLAMMDSNITFTGNESLQVLSTVPEPATILGGLAMAGAACWSQCRCLRRLAGLRPVGCAA